ncbi:MAG: formylglycine-generating enzyme family protein [Cyanobacteria bacterium J06629_19]
MASKTDLSVKKRKATNQYYDEPLTKGVLPLRMMQIPAGSFVMGSPNTELERRDSEGPQHKVMVPEFFMAKYPVTQAQWRVVVAMPQINRELDSEPSKFKGDKRPVEKVSWEDAVEFCDRLTLSTNRQYRLPTEAEWEYACRAGTTTPFHFGETLSTDYANYNGTNEKYDAYGPGSQGEYRQETTPVDQFEGANAYGLCDMHGNVWEWCQDHWHDGYEGAPTNGSAWLTNNEQASRILRGGAWDSYPRNCRSAIRFYASRAVRYDFIGFRVSCSAPRTP